MTRTQLAAMLIAALLVSGPTAAAGDTTFGMSTPKGVAWADDKYGHVDVLRKYYDGAPKALTNRPTVVSFKLPPRSVVEGEWDGYLRNWFRTLPNRVPIWWGYWHEPADNFPSAADQRLYKDAWQHIVRIERSTTTNRNLRATFIHTMHSVWRGTWGNHYPGDRFIDVIGMDGKIKNWDGRYVPAREHYAAAVRIANRHNKPFALAEYGATVLNGNYRGRAEWMRDTAKWLNRIGAPFACWWDQNGSTAGTNAGDFRLNDRPSIDAMKWMLRGRWQ